MLLVGANVNDDKDFLNSMIELASLADSLDLQVINSISQNVKDITSNYYIGSGKVKEIKSYLKEHDIDLIIFNKTHMGGLYKNHPMLLKFIFLRILYNVSLLIVILIVELFLMPHQLR